MLFEINTPIWIYKKNNWVSGYIISINEKENNFNIKDDEGEEYTISKDEIELRNKNKADDDLSDLIDLPHLNEPSMLNSLKIRYKSDVIYTFTGPILIAINPFKPIDIYGDKYLNENIEIPHIYTISNNAYHTILDNNSKDQSILVSGESGAGKTQSTKYLMKYLANLSSKANQKENENHNQNTNQNINYGIEDRILESNPILEAFGNAKTRRNDNSSRFGKFISLIFDTSGILKGAEIETYLLERVRLVSQPTGERNFHIFYMLLKGLDKEMLKNRYNIDNVDMSQYYLINSSECYERNDNVSDEETFEEFYNALKTINFSDNEIQEIYDLSIGLLLLGNIDFINQDENSEKICLMNEDLFENVCRILKFDPTKFKYLLTKKKIKTKLEEYDLDYNMEQADINKYSFIKVLYNGLFEWIVKNKSICEFK